MRPDESESLQPAIGKYGGINANVVEVLACNALVIGDDDAIAANDEAGAFAAGRRRGEFPGRVAIFAVIEEKLEALERLGVVGVRAFRGLDHDHAGRDFFKDLDETFVDCFQQTQGGRSFFAIRCGQATGGERDEGEKGGGGAHGGR